MKTIIRKYISEEILSEDLKFDDDSSLYDLNILSSINMIKLISFLEENFSISVDLGDVIVDDFESIDSIVSFLETKGIVNV